MTSSLRTRTALAAAPLAAALLLPLAGCSAVGDLLQQEASHTFATRADLDRQWGKDARWLPTDATAITTHESTAGDPASLTAASEATLDPARCAEVDRQSAPVFTLEGTPDVYKVDQVFACGDWAVIATDDGWYGWTPNHPDEQAQSPAP
ncbi:hypothetical protein AB3M83_02495 [Microbacterium sp. 179-B 1A2 NHS]|uniref:hypothetical protein n=1 Tax=Microbacterium sp. 179-B 1A2 NHS TaxID=3142383 RepID=UPI0039A030FD